MYSTQEKRNQYNLYYKRSLTRLQSLSILYNLYLDNAIRQWKLIHTQYMCPSLQFTENTELLNSTLGAKFYRKQRSNFDFKMANFLKKKK